MDTLVRLQARLASLTELRELIRAMRALAASHIREAQETLAGVRRYVEVVEGALARSASLVDGAGPAAESGDRGVAIIVCSEHGFVGALNERLLNRAAELPGAHRLVVVGRKGTLLAHERGLDVDRSFAMPTHIGGLVGITRQIAMFLGTTTVASAVFATHQRGADFAVRTQRILPLDPVLLTRREKRGPPLHHLPADVLLEQLAGEYLFAEITRMVTESLASENAARLAVMEAADHNIGDRLDKLSHEQRSQRQSAITAELLDVVIGSEAILGDDAAR